MPRAFSVLAILIAACSSDPEPASSSDAGDVLGDADLGDAGAPPDEKVRTDGGFVAPDGGILREDRFVTKVVSFTPGPCAGFGSSAMPDVVLGPPVGKGATGEGSLDVVSLGAGGEIVLSFEPNAIVDGPGVDFLVFENAFYISGDPSHPFAELGEVSVSDDGTTWSTFPCSPPDAGQSTDFGACAGWHPVYSSPSNGISPFDPASAGGDGYDLADLGVAHARFVRIRDVSGTCSDAKPKPINVGFDLDAVAIVNAETP